MDIEALMAIQSKIQNYMQVTRFASTVIWVSIFYILWKMYRLPFLRWLLWSELISVFAWFWAYRYYWFPRPKFDSVIIDVWLEILDMIIDFIPSIIGIIGSIKALAWLQDRFKEYNARLTSSSSDVEMKPK